MICLLSHITYRFTTHIIISRKTWIRCESIGTDKQLIYIKRLHASSRHRSNHDLRALLVFASQQNDLQSSLLTYIISNKSGIGDHGHILFCFCDFQRDQCTARTGFNHKRLPILNIRHRQTGNSLLDFIMIDEPVCQIITVMQSRISMLPQNQTTAFQLHEILANRHLWNRKQLR